MVDDDVMVNDMEGSYMATLPLAGEPRGCKRYQGRLYAEPQGYLAS